MTKVNVTIKGSNRVSAITQKNRLREFNQTLQKDKAKLDGVSRTKFRFPRPRSSSQSKVKGVSLTNCVSAITQQEAEMGLISLT